MKTTYVLSLLLFSAIGLQAQSPAAFGKKVRYMPRNFAKPAATTNINENDGNTSLPWIVFSDRDENFTTTAPGGSLIMKKLSFMEAFYVSKESNGYLKLVKYKPGMVRGRKITDKKTAISYGWLPKSKLLLWQRSYSNPKSGYANKAISIINGKNPLTEPRFYFDNTDSVFVYTTPDLKDRATKIRLHEIAYIFKKSEDGKKYLIGGDDQLVADSARKSIYGWVSADVIHNWGDRLYISPRDLQTTNRHDSVATAINSGLRGGQGYLADPLLPANNVILRSIPVVSDADGKTYTVGTAYDVYEKSQNKVISIKGTALPYLEYLKLRKNIHNINVVFVVDGGSPMTNYFSSLTNTIQSFENVFNEFGKKHNISYGGVVYRAGGNCPSAGVTNQRISTDYRELMRFFSNESKNTERCNGRVTEQPVFEGVRTALGLFAGKDKETNLIVLIGSTGSENQSAYQLSKLSEDVSNSNARILAIQLYSAFDQSFNNFVIQSRKLVSEAAFKSADMKKNYMVKGEGLTTMQPYNTTRQDSISYYLDYPANSLIQGAVVFPTKGMVKSNDAMNIALRRFMKETDMDISTQISSLDSAFRLTGIERKNLTPAVESVLQAPVDGNVADRMPHNAFKYYIPSTAQVSMVSGNPDALQYAIVLNNMEYKQLNDILSLMIGENLQADQSSFRSKLVSNYISIPKDQLDLKLSKGDVKRMSLQNYFRTVTGLPIQNELLGKFRVVDLKRPGTMPQQEFEQYIKFLIDSSQRIKRNTQIEQQFVSNGKTYYYITESNFKPEEAAK
ncbi:type VI secretion system protein TssR domain-containing protein [Pedobacter sp. SYP-B3415]|uniref:type VI secretion system protein TssR domain-containing protein n=1 Tax=Pedobacter sp. SYP-B3415 TaxID=2496641 RepID=UPI00101BB077|nr:type VI secretion system protein TssR domain-containing protein [Pedobacter sp. SYP-B3415]